MKPTRLAPALVLLLCLPAAANAQKRPQQGSQGQAFGLGGRIAFVHADVRTETTSLRFLGGQMRARLSRRTAFEVSMDVRSETNEAETRRVRDVPIQVSLLLYPVRSTFSPYFLGGGGWYSHRLETLAGDETLSSESTRDFGWHGGLGAELKLGAHAGLHGDYRYTFLDFGQDVPIPEAPQSGGGGPALVGRFLPSYKGSMWTAGLTLYF
jgi:opacity protein-like surface antigen